MKKQALSNNISLCISQLIVIEMSFLTNICFVQISLIDFGCRNQRHKCSKEIWITVCILKLSR